jgi:hypothetical protein
MPAPTKAETELRDNECELLRGCIVGEPSGRLQQNLKPVVCVRGDLRHCTDDRLRLRPANFKRLVQSLVGDKLDRPSEAQGRNRLVGLLIGEAGTEELRSRRASCSVSRSGRAPTKTVTLAIAIHHLTPASRRRRGVLGVSVEAGPENP